MSEATQAFSFTRRAWILGAGQGLFGVALAARMGWLAVAENERYNLLSESNRVDMTLMPPRRGWLLDRNGLPIANNRTDFRIDIIPDRFHEPDRVLPLLGRLLQLPDDEMARLRIDLKRAAGFQPVQVAERLDWERFAAVSVRLPELPGVVPTRGFARHYPAGAAVAHLTGYVGAATAEQFKETRDQLYVTPGFKLGKDGLEKTLEPVLRGQAGAKRIEVTAGGKLVQPLETKLDEPGRNVRLTIDAGLQEYAARRLGPHSGSAVVMDCRTGELLATVSMPAYDPNSFSDGISQLEWKMLSDDDHVPLMNKIAQGLYPPGSTVKPMNSLALLKAGVSPADRVSCSGALRVGSGVFHCHKRRGHGSVDMRQAVALSCDIYFYEMARRIGYDAFAPVAKSLGMGERFDLPFGTQRYGTVPDSAWKLKKYKDKWTVADTLNSSIGQGYVLSNPLQLCVMAARIASGRVVQPTLLARRVDRNPPVLDATPEHLAVVRDAMWAVVNGGGTAGRARLKVPGVELAGKTGTAQVRRITMAERRSGVLGDSSLPFKLRDHSLFMGFAPAAEPRYAVAVVLEHSGHIVTAAPMASDIITYLYDRERALKTLEPLEKDWGGDIATRLAAQSVAYKAARDAEAGVATRIDGVVPSEAPAVEAAAALATEAQAALLALGDGGVARDGTTEQAQ
ncbi:penicillin-binding protein 2 [uncultured Sphingomonas sp.]|uniref:penicillin-binding protein 2 n=1 Tax=uncultured Sphingomonas sp. TaxID=158754 RepID=UPI0035CBACCA